MKIKMYDILTEAINNLDTQDGHDNYDLPFTPCYTCNCIKNVIREMYNIDSMLEVKRSREDVCEEALRMYKRFSGAVRDRRDHGWFGTHRKISNQYRRFFHLCLMREVLRDEVIEI